MEVHQLIEEINVAGENLSKESANKSQLSTAYCRKASKALDKITNKSDYNEVITGLWFVAAHLNQHLVFVKPIRAFTELSLKLFRQCAKAILNIQWEKLEEDSSLRHNFLASLANLHAKLVPLNISRFQLLESLSESPWTHPTLAKVMGGELDDDNKEEVQCYIRNEDPIILQLRVDMMLKENCEEYALNLCNSYLGHPELKSDLGVRKTQFFLLYKLGQEDKLQEECQKLSIKDAVHVIKQLQTSKAHRKMCTVLAQTFMVQNWIRPSDVEASKELLRLWIVHQLLVDKEPDQFKESVWAMAKLSQSTDQIIVFIDVLRETCGETYLQLYVDMCIFAINVDKGQMEMSIKEGNTEAAAARRSDMASVCAKLSCLCHQTSVKVARMCVLTAFALKPEEQSFVKIGAFYDQGSDCCDKCGNETTGHEPGTINPATLYEVERLLNMLRPDYLSPSPSYSDIQVFCRRYLYEGLQIVVGLNKTRNTPELVAADVPNPETSNAKSPVSSSVALFECLCSEDVQNIQLLLNKMNQQDAAPIATPQPRAPAAQVIYQPTSNITTNIQHNQSSSFSFMELASNAQQIHDELTSCEPADQYQHNQTSNGNELQDQQHGNKETSGLSVNLQRHQQSQALIQQQIDQNKQLQEIIVATVRQDSTTLQRLMQAASPELLQAVLRVIKEKLKPSAATSNHQPQNISHVLSSLKPQEKTSTTVSTLFCPSLQSNQQQALTQQPNQQQALTQQPNQQKALTQQPNQQQTQQPNQQQALTQQPNQPQAMQHLPTGQHLRPQQHARPIILSASKNCAPLKTQETTTVLLNTMTISPSYSQINSRNILTTNSTLSSNGQPVLFNSAQPSLASSSHPVLASTAPTASASSASAEEQQRAQTFLLAKSRVEDIRHFLQAQMPNLQQMQVTEPWQMSGSVVTLNNGSKNVTQDGPQYIFAGKQSAAVELIKSTALATPPVQEISTQSRLQQLGQLLTSQADQIIFKQGQIYIAPSSLTKAHLSSQTGASEFQQNSTQGFSSFHNTAAAPNSVSSTSCTTLTSSTLLRPIISQKIQTPIKPQVHGSRMPLHLHGGQFSVPYAPHISSITINKKQPQKIISISNLPSSYVQSPSVTEISQRSALYVTTHTLSSINTISQSGPNWKLPITCFPRSKCPVPRSQELKPNTLTVSIRLPENNAAMSSNEETAEQAVKNSAASGESDMDAAVYRCILCSLAFKTLERLQEHVKTVCRPDRKPSNVFNTKFKMSKATATNTGVETTTVFQCLRCFELCISNAGIKQHRMVCRKVPPLPSCINRAGISRSEDGAFKIAVGSQSAGGELKENLDSQVVNSELSDMSGDLSGNMELDSGSVNQSVTSELNMNSDSQSINNELPAIIVSNMVTDELFGSNVGDMVTDELFGSNVGDMVTDELFGSNVSLSVVNELNNDSNKESICEEHPNNFLKRPVNGEVKDSSQVALGLMPQSLVLPVTTTQSTNITTSKSAICTTFPTVQSGHIDSHVLLPTVDSFGNPYDTRTIFQTNLIHPITATSADDITTASVPNHIFTSESSNSALSEATSHQSPLGVSGINSKVSNLLNVDMVKLEPAHTFTNPLSSSSSTTESNHTVSIDMNETNITNMNFGEKFTASQDLRLNLKTSESLVSIKDAGLCQNNVKCDLCHITYRTESDLLKHFVLKHLKSFTASKSPDGLSYLCHFCQNTFTPLQKFMQHLLNHSVTIYEKMKAVIDAHKLPCSSKTITSQRGLSLKANVSAKRVKARNNPKVSSKTVTSNLKSKPPHTGLRISQRKKQLLSKCAPHSPAHKPLVHRTYRSATIARNNAQSKPNKKSLCQEYKSSIGSPIKHLLRKRDQGINNAGRKRLLNTNNKDVHIHPATRRKQFVRKKFQPSRKIKTSPSLAMGTQTRPIRKRADCESSDLQFFQSDNGNFMPVPQRTQQRRRSSSDRLEGQNCEASALFIRSLTNQQKERLQTCDLHPTVVLKTLCPDYLEAFHQHRNGSAGTTNKQECLITPERTQIGTSEAHDGSLRPERSTFRYSNSNTPSFLDSYLSYLSQYPTSGDVKRLMKTQNNSGPRSVQQPHVPVNKPCANRVSKECQIPGGKSLIPGEESQIPGGKSLISGEESQIPGGESQIPGGESQIPGGESQIPGGESQIPGGKSLIPGEESQIPGEESQIPGGKSLIPGEESQIPGEESQIPGGKSLIPGEESHVSIGESQISVQESQIPSEKGLIPGRKSQIPGEESQIPGGESQIPGGESQIPGGKGQIDCENISAIAQQISTKQEDEIVRPNVGCECTQWNMQHYPDTNDTTQSNDSKALNLHCAEHGQDLNQEAVAACRSTLLQNELTAHKTSPAILSSNHIELDEAANSTTVTSEQLRINAQMIPESFSFVDTEMPDNYAKNISTESVSREFSCKEHQSGYQSLVEPVSSGDNGSGPLLQSSPVCVARCKSTEENFEKSDVSAADIKTTIHNAQNYDFSTNVVHLSHFHHTKTRAADSAQNGADNSDSQSTKADIYYSHQTEAHTSDSPHTETHITDSHQAETHTSNSPQTETNESNVHSNLYPSETDRPVPSQIKTPGCNTEVKGKNEMMVTCDHSNSKVISTGAEYKFEKTAPQDQGTFKCNASLIEYSEHEEQIKNQTNNHGMVKINTQIQASDKLLLQNGYDSKKHEEQHDIICDESICKSVEFVPRPGELDLEVVQYEEVDKNKSMSEQINREDPKQDFGEHLSYEKVCPDHLQCEQIYREGPKTEQVGAGNSPDTKHCLSLENEIMGKCGNQVTKKSKFPESSDVIEGEDVQPKAFKTGNLNNRHDNGNDKKQIDYKDEQRDDELKCFDLVTKQESLYEIQESKPYILNKKLSTIVPCVDLGEKYCSVSDTNDPKMTVEECEFSQVFDAEETAASENNNFNKSGENDFSDKETKLRRKGRSQKWPRNTSQSTYDQRSGTGVGFGHKVMEAAAESNKSFSQPKRAAKHSPKVTPKKARTQGIPVSPKLKNGRSASSPSLHESHSPAYVTRSSDALSKDLHQKTLRNREINLSP